MPSCNLSTRHDEALIQSKNMKRDSAYVDERGIVKIDRQLLIVDDHSSVNYEMVE